MYGSKEERMQAPKLEQLNLKGQNAEILSTLDDHLIISVNDRFGRVIYVNDNFCDLLGTSQNLILGEENEILKSHLHTNEVYKNLWKTLKEGDVWKGVLFYRISESRHYWLQTTVYPIKDKKDSATKYLSVYNDITDYYQKQSIDKTVALGEKVEFKSLENVVLSVNNRAKIIRAQSASLNKDYDELVGSYIYDFIDKTYHEAIKSKIAEVFNEKTPNDFQFESCQNNYSKELYLSEVQPVIDKYGEVSYAKITTELKTKDVKILRELKDIQTKYKNILKSYNLGIVVVTDSNGIIKEWNKGAEVAFGYKEDEVVGKCFTMLISKSQIETGVKELLRLKNNVSDVTERNTLEMSALKKNGTEFPIEFAVNGWFCGKEHCFSVFMIDVTKRKNLEDRLRQKTKDLELFLYRSAHDLKAPLTTAEGLLALIKDEKIDSSTSELIKLLSTSLQKGKLLFDNLAFASSISQKKRDVSAINFEKEIEKSIESLRGLDGFDDIGFDISVKQTKRFYSSKELLSSVFQNLIQNAINYKKAFSADYRPFIKINVEQDVNTVDITISDNGLGIQKENREKVFDIYYRVNNEGVQGTGLGLYIVKCIIDDLDGTIALDSNAANGTTFKITIPNLPKKK